MGKGNPAMAMSIGNRRGAAAEINVTPMIDVLLVLLIIFMVIVPTLPKGETAQTPKSHKGAAADPGAVVLEVIKGSGGDSGAELTFSINHQFVARKDLPGRLASIYANRAQRVLFLKGDDELSFAQVAEVIDITHAAGVDHVGLMTPKVLAGQ
jgi:biopolymer transport protein TolR